MLFNSYGYLFLFLPAALLGYFALSRLSTMALVWLIAASLFFYAWWNPWHLPIIANFVRICTRAARPRLRPRHFRAIAGSLLQC